MIFILGSKFTTKLRIMNKTDYVMEFFQTMPRYFCRAQFYFAGGNFQNKITVMRLFIIYLDNSKM